jgi:catecholate siderophore receptor
MQMANVRETDPNNPLIDILAGNYRMRGVELSATGHLTDSWEIFTGYAYNDAVVVASPNPLEVGHVPANAPRHTLSAWTEYYLPWHGLEIGGGISYVSSRAAASTPVAGSNIIETAPGYWTMQLMAKYPITPNISAQVNITNVTNTYYYDELHPGHIIIGPARAALFTIAAKF